MWGDVLGGGGERGVCHTRSVDTHPYRFGYDSSVLQHCRAIREAVGIGKAPDGPLPEIVLLPYTVMYSPCNAIQNHAFTVLGWLYGKDFGDKLCKAVNCGYDTDCTGATLGALLGILDGTAGIPEEWSRPVGKEIVLHKFTGHFDAPADIEELTDRAVALARQYADENGVILGEGNTIPDNILSLLFRNEEALAAAQRDIRAVAADRDLDISLHYHGEPVLYPGVARFLSVSASRHGKPVPVEVELKGPADWHIKPEGDGFLSWQTAYPIAIPCRYG